MAKQSQSSTSDIYQDRYVKHQKKKKKQLAYSAGDITYPHVTTQELEAFENILSLRRTQRTFVTSTIPDKCIQKLLKHIQTTPSSCNRQAISLKLVEGRHKKELLSGLLVGGVGWCHRAGAILLIFADPQAYKAPGEILFMPYLDAGVVINQVYLSATALNLGAGYINPNIREENRRYFDENFNQELKIFCGAFALGEYEVKAEETPKDGKLIEIL